jgi:hypothetical protein
MSADHLTEDFAAYFHEDCAAVFWRSGEMLIRLDGHIMRQLQSIADSWANARTLPARDGRELPMTGHDRP